MLRPYLKILEWELIFGRAVKAISSSGILSPCLKALLLKIKAKKVVLSCRLSRFEILSSIAIMEAWRQNVQLVSLDLNCSSHDAPLY